MADPEKGNDNPKISGEVKLRGRVGTGEVQLQTDYGAWGAIFGLALSGIYPTSIGVYGIPKVTLLFQTSI